MLFIVDIDGSIADIRDRAAKAGRVPEREDRISFQKWLDLLQSHETLAQDKPIPATQKLVRDMSKTSDIIYLTGRAEKYREVTESWLRQHNFPKAPLIMREDTDWRSAADYKEEHVAKWAKQYSTILVLDDDADHDCSERYKLHGAVHLKVLL